MSDESGRQVIESRGPESYLRLRAQKFRIRGDAKLGKILDDFAEEIRLLKKLAVEVEGGDEMNASIWLALQQWQEHCNKPITKTVRSRSPFDPDC